jgi:hypothetical protein
VVQLELLASTEARLHHLSFLRAPDKVRIAARSARNCTLHVREEFRVMIPVAATKIPQGVRPLKEVNTLFGMI